MTSLRRCAHARMCALSRYTRECAHYPDTRENVRTIPMHARMYALSRCTRGCVHYPDTREDVCIIPIHAKVCALSRCTRGCVHYHDTREVYIYRFRYCLSCWSCDVHTSVQRTPTVCNLSAFQDDVKGNCESTDRTSIIHSACTVVW